MKKKIKVPNRAAAAEKTRQMTMSQKICRHYLNA
jgi:hypothetical protein